MKFSLAKSKELRAKRNGIGHWIFGIRHVTLQPGITLVELLVVMGILAIIFTFTTVNIIPLRDHASLNTTVSTLVADIRQQQLKAMIGDTDGNASRSAYGIYFTSGGYTVFPGSSYTAGNTRNFSATLDSSVEFLNTFTNNTLIFASASGEFVNYSASNNTLTVRVKATGEQKVLQFNKYGTVSAVN